MKYQSNSTFISEKLFMIESKPSSKVVNIELFKKLYDKKLFSVILKINLDNVTKQLHNTD